jgi:hypothetical protein
MQVSSKHDSFPDYSVSNCERLLSSGGLNQSMQHLHSSPREGDVENEATTEDLLQRRAKKLDVGSLAER